MIDVQQARMEAAARAMWERSPREGDPTWADLDYGIKEIWRKDAAAAIADADAVVTVEMLKHESEVASSQRLQDSMREYREVTGDKDGPTDWDLEFFHAGYKHGAMSVIEAVHRLYRGEGQP